MYQIADIELSAPQASFISSQAEKNLLHCGQGFGKTHVEGVISAYLVMNCPKALGLIAANTYQQLSDATLFRIFEVWKTYFGWTEFSKGNPNGNYVIDKEPPRHFKPHGYTFKTNAQKIFFKNGAVIMVVSLDNYMALDGREISWALLDETKDTPEIAVKEVILGRLRAKGVNLVKDFLFKKDFFGFCNAENERAGKQVNPLWIVTSPAKTEWLSKMFNLESNRFEIESTIFNNDDYYYNQENNKCCVIASAYWNKYLPENYINSKIADLSKDRIDMLVYGSPFGKSGVEYYSNFDRKRHVKYLTFTKGHPLHLCFDFNVNPYMTLIVCQIVNEANRMKLKVLNEFCLESPDNTIEGVCRRFKNEYEHLCNAGLFFYGDASGKNSLPIEDAKNFYKVVEKSLYELLQDDSKRLLRKNINHRAVGKNTLGRRDFMNKFLNGSLGIDLEIDQSCVRTIADFEHVKEDANGAKEKKKEKINDILCEKYGHTTDALDGLVCYLWY